MSGDIINAAQEVIITGEGIGATSCVPDSNGNLPVIAGQTGTWNVNIENEIGLTGSVTVAGASPVGATLSLPPVAVSGADAEGKKRNILTDANGVVQVTAGQTGNWYVGQTGTWSNVGVTGTIIANQGTQGTTAAAWYTKITDGTTVAGVDTANHLYVSGKSAAGIAPSSNPVYVSGIDGGGLKRGILTDTTGAVQVARLPIALGAALDANYQVLVGGSVTTTAPTYTTGQINPLSLDTTGAVRVNVTTFASDSTTPVIYNVTCTNANTEYSQALPTNCRRFLIQLRTTKDLKVSFTSGQSGTTYVSVLAGGQYYEDTVNLTAKTLYFQSPTAGVVAEILAWT